MAIASEIQATESQIKIQWPDRKNEDSVRGVDNSRQDALMTYRKALFSLLLF
jgi:hypothetical protein